MAVEINISNWSSKFDLSALFSGLSNSKGGTLLFGVKSNGKVIGCYPREILDLIEEIQLDFILGVVNYETNISEINHKLIVRCDIYPSPIIKSKTSGLKWKSYFYSDDMNYELGKVAEHCIFNNEDERDLNNWVPSLIELNIAVGERLSLTQLYRKLNLPIVEAEEIILSACKCGQIEIVFDGEKLLYQRKTS